MRETLESNIAQCGWLGAQGEIEIGQGMPIPVIALDRVAGMRRLAAIEPIFVTSVSPLRYNLKYGSISFRDEGSAMASAVLPIKGLEGIIATKSSICYIDGEAGVLAYRGIDIHELAEHSDFEETTYLLWFGKLPTESQLTDFRKELAAARTLNWRIYDFLRSVPHESTPMEVLRTAVSLLSLYDPDEKDMSHEANLRKSYRLTSQIAMIVAIFDRIRKGKMIVDPDKNLSHSANFLRMLNGVNPSDTATRALDVALILQADHELNASTFAARVIASTLSDMHSAIVGAIGALKGPLHGGANAETMKLLFAIDDAKADPVEYVRNLLAQKKKISGFGHRVYTTEDPRRPTCGRCRGIWARQRATASGTTCRARLSCSSIRRRS